MARETTASPTTTARVAAAIGPEQSYEHEETGELVALVNDAAELVHTRGEEACRELAVPESQAGQCEVDTPRAMPGARKYQ